VSGIAPTHLRVHVIEATLRPLGLWSPAAEDLLLGTAAVESRCGQFLVQHGGGPALGIFQMEPETHDDIWQNWLRYRTHHLDDLTMAGIRSGDPMVWPSADHLVTDLAYATAMARFHYRRVPEALPNAGDVPALARYWKQHYNTPLGAGTEAKFISAWNELVDR
jgi:hypothetical protein